VAFVDNDRVTIVLTAHMSYHEAQRLVRAAELTSKDAKFPLRCIVVDAQQNRIRPPAGKTTRL
jgi:hypothetical protein